MKELEKKLRSLLKGENTGLIIEFNQHRVYYVKAAEAVEDGTYDYADWISEEEKQKAIATDSVWNLHWYPDTPIGSHSILGSTLESVVNSALEQTQSATDKEKE